MTRLRIPADVDRDDQLLAGLSARQLAVVATGGVACWLVWATLHVVAPPVVVALLCSPIVVVVTVLAAARLDGLHGVSLAAEIVRYLARPRRQVLGTGTTASSLGSLHLGHLHLGVDAVAEDGVLSCGDDHVMVCRASAPAFHLRTDAEQEAITGAFGRYLNGLASAVQIVVHVDRADLSGMISTLRHGETPLPHPALRRAADEHAAFLRQLEEQQDVVHRTVLLVLRVPAAEDARALARCTADALAPAGVRVEALSGHDAVAVLTRIADRTTEAHDPAMALPGEVIRGGEGQ